MLLLAALAVALVAAVGVAYVRVTAQPDLGPPPRGPAHGASEVGIAAWAARALTPALALRGHGTVTLSEADLTLELRLHSTGLHDFSAAEARVRDGVVVVDGDTHIGPVAVVAVGRLELELVHDADGRPDVGVRIDEIDAGDLTLPGPARDAVEKRVRAAVHLDSLLAASPLAEVRNGLECVSVGPGGVTVGFHSPLAAADPARCGP